MVRSIDLTVIGMNASFKRMYTHLDTKSYTSTSVKASGGGFDPTEGVPRDTTIVRLTNHLFRSEDLGYHKSLLANREVHPNLPWPSATLTVSLPVIIFQNGAFILLFVITTSPYDINLEDMAQERSYSLI